MKKYLMLLLGCGLFSCKHTEVGFAEEELSRERSHLLREKVRERQAENVIIRVERYEVFEAERSRILGVLQYRKGAASGEAIRTENGLFVFTAEEDYLDAFLDRLRSTSGVRAETENLLCESNGQVTIPLVQQSPTAFPFSYQRQGEMVSNHAAPIVETSLRARPFRVSGRILQVELIPTITFLDDPPRLESFPELKTSLVVESGNPIILLAAENKPQSLGDALLGSGPKQGRRILLAVLAFELPS